MTPTAPVDPNMPVYAQPNPQAATAPAKPAEPPPPPPKAVPPKPGPHAADAKKELDEETKQEAPAPLEKQVLDATTIPDEAAFQAYAAKASMTHPDFLVRYERYCKAAFGYVPLRLQNLPDGNQYHVAAGPDSVRALPAVPDGLTQCDIALLNAGVPIDVVKPEKDTKASAASGPKAIAPPVHDDKGGKK